MKRILRRGAVVPLFVGLLLGACAQAPSDEHVVQEPVRLEDVSSDEDEFDSEDIQRVILTPRAVERTGIETALVKRSGKRLVVPHAAILFDPEGRVWVYTNPEPRVYVRHKVTLAYEEGDKAFLSDGPAPGTRVVTVGVPELYGAEYEVGH